MDHLEEVYTPKSQQKKKDEIEEVCVVSGGVSGKEEEKEDPTEAGAELKLKRTDTTTEVSFNCNCEGCGLLSKFLGL